MDDDPWSGFKRMCMQQMYEKQEVDNLHIHVREAIGQDIAKYVESNVDALVNASLNNDTPKVAEILDSFKTNRRDSRPCTLMSMVFFCRRTPKAAT